LASLFVVPVSHILLQAIILPQFQGRKQVTCGKRRWVVAFYTYSLKRKRRVGYRWNDE